MTKRVSLFTILRKIHDDEAGSVSLETVLLIAAIALPVLIFTIKVGWPRIKGYFNEGLNDLENAGVDAAS